MGNIIEKFELLQHLNRVSEMSYKMAQYFELDETECKEIAIAGHLHDVGKILMNPDILNKRGKLTSEEKNYLQEHVKYSYALSYVFEHKLSANIVRMIHEHHENHDGTGYPNSLSGDEILFGSHIIKICDVYDAMRSDRPYRAAMSVKETIGIILKDRDKYHPRCIAALIELTKDDYKEAI